MRWFVLAVALCVGLPSTDALARDQVLVKLRDKDAAKSKPTASKTTAKKKQPVRKKTVAKAKPRAKAKAKAKPAESRPRPMP